MLKRSWRKRGGCLLRKAFLIFASVLAAAVAVSSAAVGQQGGSCQTTEASDPPRVILSCANGLVIEAEAPDVSASGFRLPALQAPPVSVDVTSQGVLVTLPPGKGPFQIMTPHAIVSVRGTLFVVDVTAVGTAVFVVEGLVEVRRLDGSDPVELGGGDGVTVSAGTPMEVKQWPAEKVSALLMRFGR